MLMNVKGRNRIRHAAHVYEDLKLHALSLSKLNCRVPLTTLLFESECGRSKIYTMNRLGRSFLHIKISIMIRSKNYFGNIFVSNELIQWTYPFSPLLYNIFSLVLLCVCILLRYNLFTPAICWQESVLTSLCFLQKVVLLQVLSSRFSPSSLFVLHQ